MGLAFSRVRGVGTRRQSWSPVEKVAMAFQRLDGGVSGLFGPQGEGEGETEASVSAI